MSPVQGTSAFVLSFVADLTCGMFGIVSILSLIFSFLSLFSSPLETIPKPPTMCVYVCVICKWIDCRNVYLMCVRIAHLLAKKLNGFIYSYRRSPWCNCYRRCKWTRRHEFKSWTRLIAFHIALIPLGKVWIQLFSLRLWVNCRTDCVLQPRLGN